MMFAKLQDVAKELLSWKDVFWRSLWIALFVHILFFVFFIFFSDFRFSSRRIILFGPPRGGALGLKAFSGKYLDLTGFTLAKKLKDGFNFDSSISLNKSSQDLFEKIDEGFYSLPQSFVDLFEKLSVKPKTSPKGNLKKSDKLKEIKLKKAKSIVPKAKSPAVKIKKKVSSKKKLPSNKPKKIKADKAAKKPSSENSVTKKPLVKKPLAKKPEKVKLSGKKVKVSETKSKVASGKNKPSGKASSKAVVSPKNLKKKLPSSDPCSGDNCSGVVLCKSKIKSGLSSSDVASGKKALGEKVVNKKISGKKVTDKKLGLAGLKKADSLALNQSLPRSRVLDGKSNSGAVESNGVVAVGGAVSGEASNKAGVGGGFGSGGAGSGAGDESSDVAISEDFVQGFVYDPEIGNKIRKFVSDLWNLPAGCQDSGPVLIEAEFLENGDCKVSFIEKSGIPIKDYKARQIVYAMRQFNELRGKVCRLAFR